MFKVIVCLILGHKRLNVVKNDYHSPFGVGVRGEEGYYPVWPCDRCNVMYIERAKKYNDLTSGVRESSNPNITFLDKL